jgi:hypothetical protein
MQKTRKIEKVTGSQDDDFVGVLKKNIPTKGPQNRRSLGIARDDKGKGGGSVECGCWIEAFLTAGPRAHGNSNAAQLMPGPFVQRFVAWLVAVSLLADDFFDHGTQFLALAGEFSHKFLETA